MKNTDIRILSEAVKLATAVVDNPAFNAQFQETLLRRTGEEDPVLMFCKYYYNHLKNIAK